MIPNRIRKKMGAAMANSTSAWARADLLTRPFRLMAGIFKVGDAEVAVARQRDRAVGRRDRENQVERVAHLDVDGARRIRGHGRAIDAVRESVGRRALGRGAVALELAGHRRVRAGGRVRDGRLIVLQVAAAAAVQARSSIRSSVVGMLAAVQFSASNAPKSAASWRLTRRRRRSCTGARDRRSRSAAR